MTGLSRAVGGTPAWEESAAALLAGEVVEGVVWEEMEAAEETIRRQEDLVATIRRPRLTTLLPQTRHQPR
jgi:hypothetical protein